MFKSIRNRLVYKLLFIFFVAIILPVGIATLFVYDHMQKKYYENVISSLGWGENYVKANFDNELKLLQASLLKIKNNSRFTTTITDQIKNSEIIKLLLYETISENNLDFIYVYNENDEILYQTGKFIQLQSKLLNEKNTTPEICYLNSKFITQVKINFKTNDPDNKNITIFLGKILSEQMLYDLSRILELDFILMKENDQQFTNVYSTLFDSYGKSLHFSLVEVGDLGRNKKIEEIDIIGKKYHSKLFNLLAFDEKYTGLILARENLSYINRTGIYLLLFFAGIALLVAFTVWFIRKTILKPVTQLLVSIQDASSQIENARPIEQINVNTKDEIFMLAKAYNIMAANLGQSFSKVKYLQNYLLNIIESMPSSLIALDKGGKITQWNQAAVDFTGILRSDAMGKIIWKLLPDLGIDVKKLNNTQFEKTQKEFYKESIWDGEKRSLNVHIFPLISNGVQGNVIRIDDITDMKSKEEQLLQAQKMETLGTLAGGIAHDFNNILSGIVGVISILSYKINKNEELSRELLKEYLDIMEESGKRAGDIVQSLLTLSKKQNTQSEPVNLSEVIDHVEKICLNSFDKRIEIKKINTSGDKFIFADFTQIEQLLLNLSINSSHAMTIMKNPENKQGGVLTFEIQDIGLEEISKLTDNVENQEFLKIIVKDTGIGMSHDVIKQIYEPFFSTKDKESGTGLGLTMVYNIVNQFNGFIDVHSVPNEGTQFNVYFPKYDVLSNADTYTDDINLKRGTGTILVIDDEQILRELAISMLSQCGYDVITAKDGVEGVKIYNENKSIISGVILDMVMPKMNGKETYIELKKINPEIKVLLASGFTRDDRVEEVLKLGVTDFIQKPYTIFNLSRTIHKVINGE